MNENGLGNVLRLASLKNVSGRKKVLPGAEFLNQLEDYDTDVSGTSLPPPGVGVNMPEADLGGELTAKSYDVRANTAQDFVGNQAATPEPEQEPESFWSRFGRALAYQTHNVPTPPKSTPPVETLQVEASEGLPNQAPPEQPPSSPNTTFWDSVKSLGSTIGNALSDYVKPFGTEEHLYGTGQSDNKKIIEDAQLRAQGIVPEQHRAEQEQAKQAEQAQFQAQLEKAQENPMAYIVYGATDVAANMPELQKQVKEIAGIDFTDQIAEMTKKYEKVLSDQENLTNQEMQGYDEQMRRINERIATNQATDGDKFYIGLALLMPLLVGAIFGKEAGLGALGGTAKGLAGVFQNREEGAREDEKLLADITKLKGQNDLRKTELDLERLKIPENVRKGLPKDEREHLIGKNEITWTDPKTGKQETGVQIKPGLVARNEFITDKEELKEMRKEANEISDAIIPTKDINKLTKDIIYLSSHLKDKNILGQAFQSYLIGKNPGLSSKLGEEIEFEGRKVNSMIALEHKLKLLTDAYRQAKGMRALTNTVQEHIDGLFRNPSASFQSYRDTIDQMLYTRDLTQNRLFNTVSSHGFVPEILMEELGKENKGVYDQLNYQEGENLSSSLLKD